MTTDYIRPLSEIIWGRYDKDGQKICGYKNPDTDEYICGNVTIDIGYERHYEKGSYCKVHMKETCKYLFPSGYGGGCLELKQPGSRYCTRCNCEHQGCKNDVESFDPRYRRDGRCQGFFCKTHKKEEPYDEYL